MMKSLLVQVRRKETTLKDVVSKRKEERERRRQELRRIKYELRRMFI